MDELPAPPVEIAGLSTEEAVERLLDALDDPDPNAVQPAVRGVADDGVVSRSAAESALAHCSKVVTTAESRTEFAGDAVGAAREAASEAPDLGVVEGRLSALESDLASVEARTDDLGTDLGTVVDHLEDGSLYAVGVGIRRVAARARDVTRAADELSADAEAFERWLDDPGHRVEELSADLDAFVEFLDGIDRAVEALDDGPAPAEPGLAWFDAALRHRVTDPLLADLRAELADLRTWADRADLEASAGPGGVEARVDDLDDRRTRLGDRLDDLGTPARRDRYADRLADFEAALAAFDPPVDWGAVLAELDAHRPDRGEGSDPTDPDPDPGRGSPASGRG